MAETELENETEESQSIPVSNGEKSQSAESPVTKEMSNNNKKGVKSFFAPMKSKWKPTTSSAEKHSEWPDVFVNNVSMSEVKKIATIRKPHKPLKCPRNSDEPDEIATEEVIVFFYFRCCCNY